MAGIKPENYQAYIRGEMTLEQASGGTAASSWITGETYKPPTPAPAPVNLGTVIVPGGALNNAYLGSDGAYHGTWAGSGGSQVPAATQTAVTPFPTSGNVALTSARDQRQKEMNNNVWSNDTTIAVLEKKSWAIYVDTGRWDSPEQKQYHDQSEAIRKGLNPLYPGSPDGAPQNGYILPTDQFVTANGMDMKGLVTYGALGLGAVMILSMFRR